MTLQKPIVEPLHLLCTKANGKLKVHDLAGMNDYIAQFGDGEDFDMMIEPAVLKGTTKMRRYFHGAVLKAYMKHGWRKQEAKDMLCLRFIPQDIRLPDGSTVRVPGHTSTLSKEDYIELIDASIQAAAEDVGEVVLDGAEWLAQRRQEQRDAAKKARKDTAA